MNVIDLIVALVLALALWNGWRQGGFIVQVCSLAAIVLGIWLAAKYGCRSAPGCGSTRGSRRPGGFAAVLVATVLAVAIAARVLRKLFHFAGFGLPDILLGIAVSVVKYLLVMSALVAAFDRINADHTLVEARTIEKSRSYKPLLRLSESLFPSWSGSASRCRSLMRRDSDGESL